MLHGFEGRVLRRYGQHGAANTGAIRETRVAGLWRPQRVLLYAAALCLVTLIPYAAAVVSDVAHGAFPVGNSGAPVGGDLPSHLLGGRLFLHGDLHRLYDLDYQRQFWQAWLPTADFNPYVSPPFMTAVYAPLAALPYALALAIWTAISVTSLVLSIRLLWPLLPDLHRFGQRTLLGHLLVAPPVLYVLFGGQDSAVSLLLLTGGLRLLLGGQEIAAGALLGLGVYKPQLFVVIPLLFLVQRRWRALGGWGAVAGGLTLISMVMVGSQGDSRLRFLARFRLLPAIGGRGQGLGDAVVRGADAGTAAGLRAGHRGTADGPCRASGSWSVRPGGNAHLPGRARGSLRLWACPAGGTIHKPTPLPL
ncbi:MAG: hypothetical protein KatS3mg059_1165 [Thermomicrobiales bacterium]|nr:MAG: hypothetical protein KatS3mg059_1165 [Thermomicrobiales bacterium]